VDNDDQHFCNQRIHTILSLNLINDIICLLHVKIINHWSFFSSVSPSFLNSFSYTPLSRLHTTSPARLVFAFVCWLSMPRTGENIESVKLRLVREQQGRTDRRVRQLLRQDLEVLNESEEDNILLGRRARGLCNETTQTDRFYKSFCCGVLVDVLVVVCLLCCLIFLSRDGRKRMEK
jgi:hypothetical protein